MVLPLADAFAQTTAVPYCSEAKNLLTTCSRDRLSFQARALAAWATQELSCATLTEPAQFCGRDDQPVQRSRFCRHDGQTQGTVGVTKMISSPLSIERGPSPRYRRVIQIQRPGPIPLLPSGQRKRPLANYPRGMIPLKLTLNNENTLITQVPYAPEE